ncbi:hypothetical protein BDZ94DRAFT_1063929 [Collybia nuda]|uniref:Uncharacterized protein n=1 Tax=Collybia nuda TaxID=64659 RepID=A0A9P5XYJ9_9AGAR|nr:hypothetical protein BDZ94DRAFT_1063929 [Collybia nuda]
MGKFSIYAYRGSVTGLVIYRSSYVAVSNILVICLWSLLLPSWHSNFRLNPQTCSRCSSFAQTISNYFQDRN